MVRFQGINKYRKTSATTKQALNKYFSLFLFCHSVKYYKFVFLQFIFTFYSFMIFILFFRNNVLFLKKKKKNKCLMPVRLHLKSLLDERKKHQKPYSPNCNTEEIEYYHWLYFCLVVQLVLIEVLFKDGYLKSVKF